MVLQDWVGPQVPAAAWGRGVSSRLITKLHSLQGWGQGNSAHRGQLLAKGSMVTLTSHGNYGNDKGTKG